MSHYFDYESVAREAGIAPDSLEKLCAIVRRDFPTDEMMYELHVLRACMAVKRGVLKVADFEKTPAA